MAVVLSRDRTSIVTRVSERGMLMQGCSGMGWRLGVTHSAMLALSTHSTSTNMYSQRTSVLVSTLYLPASQLQFSVVCYLQREAEETIVESWQGKQRKEK